MRAQEFVTEKWSEKYKRSIDCSRPKGFSQKAHCAGRKLKEFAPSNSGDDGFSDDTLRRLAAQWWQGDEDPRVEQILAAAGWEIGQDEGYDNGGAFVVQAGDENGRSYMSWPAEELDAQQLDELMFKGSQCTKDCSGHMAGYEWSIRKAGRVPNSHSPSFNKGAAIQRSGL